MRKRCLSEIYVVLILCLALALCACNAPGGGSSEAAGSDAGEGGNASWELFERVQAYEETAGLHFDVGMTLSSEYFYGMAQAEVSSLRLCIDTVLWLLGEGDSLEDVIGDAPYRDWDSIACAGLGSDAPFYFEGLIYTFRGKTDEAEACYKKAAAYPSHKERDFYFLRNMSVEDLYALRKEVLALEGEVSSHFVPRASLTAGRTGAEFSPAYHLISAKQSEDPLTAKQCALNALMASPREPKLYGVAALYVMNAQDPELGSELINEGLFLWPKDGLLNLLGAFFSYSSGDYDSAKKFLAVVREGGDESLMEYATALEKEISQAPPRLVSTAFTLQEQSWLKLLRPLRLPKVSEVTSYPAELRVEFPQFTPVTFQGTLSVTGQITDEQILSALKSAVSAVPEYKSLDDAATDQSSVDKLTESVKFSKEDQDRIIHNWLSLIGYDKMYDLIRGKIPSFDSYDAASELIGKVSDAAEEFGFDIPGDDTGLILAGLMVSIKEYQNDQQKYKDIAALSQAKGRLRIFYDRVNELLRNETSKNMHWTIRILQQKTQEETFDYAYEIKAPYLYTADIELVKQDGEYADFTGTYSGYFNLSLAADLSDYDKVFCQKVADRYSKSMSSGQIKRTYSAISTTINRASESSCYVKGDGVAVTLSMPYGTNRMKFELPLDATKMESQSKVLIDKSYSFGYSGKDMSETVTHTRIEDSETGTSHLWIHRVETVSGVSKSFDEEQEGSVGDMDVRPYIQMTLVIDTRLDE